MSKIPTAEDFISKNLKYDPTKRYFGPLDIQEAKESPFCQVVVGPFLAKDRDEALEIVKRNTETK